MAALSWRKAHVKPATEFSLRTLRVIDGVIPKTLLGSLYRNGPGRLQRGDETYRHWFDGDGAILGVHFMNGEAQGVYKYVKSTGYIEESKADKIMYAGFGQTPKGIPWWKVLLGRSLKNAGNTSVLPLPDRLLALWEGGHPHVLDPKTLETYGLDNLGFLKRFEAFSAHPKVDYKTGEIFNIGAVMGPNHQFCLSRLDKHGALIKQTKMSCRPNMIHDFVIAGKYIVVMNFPTEVTDVISFFVGIKSYNDVFKWNPALGTEVMIFDRNDLSLVNKFKIDPFYSFHFFNGYQERDGTIYIELIKYNSFVESNVLLSGIPNLNQSVDYDLTGRMSYIRIDPILGKVLAFEDLGSESCEFPVVLPEKYGEKWRYSLFNTYKKHSSDERYFNAIGRYDHQTDKMEIKDCGENRYVTEPIVVPSDLETEHGHILTVVYNSQDHKSEVWIHDSKNFEGDPICRIEIPSVIPLGFHGTWRKGVL